MKKLLTIIFLSPLITSAMDYEWTNPQEPWTFRGYNSIKQSVGKTLDRMYPAKEKNSAYILDETRLSALKIAPRFLSKHAFFQKHVISPLHSKMCYSDIKEYVDEPDVITDQKRRIAKALGAKNIVLGVSQTEADILSDCDEAYYGYERKYQLLELEKKFGSFFNPLKQALELERKENKNGNIVLYHGMNAQNYALQYMGTKIHQKKDGCVVNDNFLELRHRKQPLTPPEPSSTPDEKSKNDSWYQRLISPLYKMATALIFSKKNESNINENEVRQSFIANTEQAPLSSYTPPGTGSLKNEFDGQPYIRQYLVSCSPSLLSNTNKCVFSGETTLTYWLANGNCRTNNIMENLCSAYNISRNIAAKYEPQINKAIDELNQGILLQFSLPPHLADDVMYMATPYGARAIINRKSKRVLNGEENTKIERPSDLFAQISTNPYDVENASSFFGFALSIDQDINKLQVRLVVDKSRLLDVHNPEITENFKVKAYAQDQQRLEEFQAKLNAIVDNMVNDMQK